MCPSARRRWCARGRDVTILAYGSMVHVALAAALESGIDAEVVDLRTLVPIDIAAITESVEKTGRCVIVHEATRTSGFGAELSALVQEHCFYHLEAPIERVTGWDTPYPHAFEWGIFSWAQAGGRRHAPHDGRSLSRWAATFSSFPTWAKALPKPRSSPGTSPSARPSRKTRLWWT